MLLFYVRHGDPIYSPDSLTPLGVYLLLGGAVCQPLVCQKAGDNNSFHPRKQAVFLPTNPFLCNDPDARRYVPSNV